MAVIPEFPQVTFEPVKQDKTHVEGRIALVRPQRTGQRAISICERFCPHKSSGGTISCSGMDEHGQATIAVTLTTRREKWLKFRIARAFQAPCKVTYDAITKKKA